MLVGTCHRCGSTPVEHEGPPRLCGRCGRSDPMTPGRYLMTLAVALLIVIVVTLVAR